MQNIKHEVKGNILHIEVDLSEGDRPPARVANPILIATSGGGVAISSEKPAPGSMLVFTEGRIELNCLRQGNLPG